MRKSTKIKKRRKNPNFTLSNAKHWIANNIEHFRIDGKINKILLEIGLINYFGKDQINNFLKFRESDTITILINESVREYEYKRKLNLEKIIRLNPKRKKTQYRNPHDLPTFKKQQPIWLKNKLDDFKIKKEIIELPPVSTQFKHFGEPVGKKEDIPFIAVPLDIPIRVKSIPNDKNQAFELGRLLGLKKGFECNKIKSIENLFQMQIQHYGNADKLFDIYYPKMSIKDAFNLGIIFGLKYSIQFCGITKILYRKQQVQKVNRELAQKFWEYL